MRGFLVLYFIFILNSLWGQTISGRVVDLETKESLLGVAIIVREWNKSEIKGYAITDDSGYYTLDIDSPNDTLVIEVSCLGYKKETTQFNPKLKQYDFCLKIQSLLLTEVNVKGDKIGQQGDTIVYSAPAFVAGNDRSLEDILKKMPGLSVNDNGSIRYNGKPINRFYIEGMNLLDGKYTLASRNLSVDKIASVQVLENHQPIKVLEGAEFSDRAALNIRLKKDASSQWFGNMDIASGLSSFLWQARAFAMYVAPNRQGIFSYKSNNTGVDILSELQAISLDDFLSGFYTSTTSSMLNSLFLVSPDFSPQRSFFNQSHIFTLNQLWKLHNDKELRLNVDYVHEKQEQDNFQRIAYFQPDSADVIFTESSNNQSVLDGLNGNLTFIKNVTNYYLENKLTISGKWQDVSSTVSNQNVIHQNQKIPQHLFSNQFRLIRSFKNHSFKMISSNQYEWLPQRLSTLTNGEENSFNSFIQEAGQNIFTSKTAIHYGYSIDKLVMNCQLEYAVKGSKIDAELKTEELTKNRDDYDQSEHFLSFTPDVSWMSENWNFNLKIPMKWGKIDNDIGERSRFFITPSFSLFYKFREYWNFNLNGNYLEHWEGHNQMVPERMLNYRTLYQFNGAIPFYQSILFNSRLAYRNVMLSLFGNINLMYKKARNNNTKDQRIVGGYVIRDLIKHSCFTESYMFNAEMNKMFELKNINIKLEVNGSKDYYSMMQNQVLRPCSVSAISIQSFVNFELFKKNIFTHKLQYTITSQKIDGNHRSSYKLLKQNFSLFLILCPLLDMTLSGEYFYSQFENYRNPIHSFLGDVELRSQLIKNLELGVKWSNIFNKRSYSYSNVTDMSDSFYSYKIRPTEILLSLCYKL